MKLNAAFEKRELEIGLSAARPIITHDPEASYVLADLIATVRVKYQRLSVTVDLDATTDALSLVGEAGRLRCYSLVMQLPESAIPEAEEELQGLKDHYLQIQQSRASLPPPRESGVVQATVTGRLST